MHENDDRDSMRADKPKRAPEPVMPLMIAGALYSREALIAALGSDANLITKLKRAGLKIRKPGTQHAFVFSDDVFAAIRKMTEGDDE